MTGHLNSYEALIQLLIGSVFFTMLFQREDFFLEIRQNFTSRLSSIKNYEITNNKAWNKQLKTLRRSIMIILVVYGCMVLYYCANFNIQIAEKNDPNISVSHSSLFGIALLSLLVSIYQIVTFCKPVLRMCHNKILFGTPYNNVIEAGYIIFMIIIFFIFIFPDGYNYDILYNFLEIENLESWVNLWVIINLFLWVLIYFRIYRRVKVLTYKLATDSAILSELGIENRINYIIRTLNNEKEYFKICYLRKKAKDELGKDSNYFDENELIEYLGQLKSFKDSFDNTECKVDVTLQKDAPRLTKKIKDIIDKSKLPFFLKNKLKKYVKDKPIARLKYNFFSEIQNEQSESMKANATKLCKFGFLVESQSNVENDL